MGGFGEVRREAVYVMSRSRALRIPTPPPFHNRGNWIFSLSRLARWMAEAAEAAGTMLLPETDVQQVLISDGAVRGVRTGDKGLGRDGKPLAAHEPGAEIAARVTVLAEGVQGMLGEAVIDHFGLAGDNPQTYALGVKEVWKVAKPLDRVIHTLGWPLRIRAKHREFGGSFVYPMGPEHVCVGFVAGTDAADATFSVHDTLQLFKTHPLIRGLIEGGERVAWGAKAIPEGGFWSMPAAVSAPGVLLAGDVAGFVNVPRLKGVHYAMRSGMLAAETIAQRLREGLDPQAPGVLDVYDQQIAASEIYRDLEIVRNMRQAFKRGMVVGGAVAGAMDVTRGQMPGGRWRTRRDDSEPVVLPERPRPYPAPDGTLTFDKLSSVFVSGNRSRDDQPDHLRIQRVVPREIATAWASMCPAAVYEVGEDAGDGMVHLHVAPSNCVQCGAITARGGRLTPPEGGSGPEYTFT